MTVWVDEWLLPGRVLVATLGYPRCANILGVYSRYRVKVKSQTLPARLRIRSFTSSHLASPGWSIRRPCTSPTCWRLSPYFNYLVHCYLNWPAFPITISFWHFSITQIVLLSCLGKRLERLLTKWMAHLAVAFNVVGLLWFAALPKRSATDLVSCVIHDIEGSRSQGWASTFVTLDVQSALDAVLHNRSLRKMQAQRWSDTILSWMTSLWWVGPDWLWLGRPQPTIMVRGFNFLGRWLIDLPNQCAWWRGREV